MVILFRSETLAKHVNIVDIIYTDQITKKKFDINFSTFKSYSNFQNYTNLHRFTVTQYNHSFDKKYKKIFGTVCHYTDCELYFDQFGTECPHGCRCQFERLERWHYVGLTISCSNREAVMELKELPKPFRGAPALVLTSLNLTELPNTSIAGYSSVKLLNVMDNQLDDINISQLPENLTELDIRNNNLKDLRPEVLDFLNKRNGKFRISMSGNPWTCDCYGDFLDFLSQNTSNIMIRDFYDVQCDGVTRTQREEICRTRRNYKVSAVAILLLIIAVAAIVCCCRKSKN